MMNFVFGFLITALFSESPLILVSAQINAPIFISARYQLADMKLELLFDGPIFFEGLTDAFSCDYLFSFKGSTSSVCVLSEQMNIVTAVLPSKGTLCPALRDSIQLRPNIVRAACPTDYPNPELCKLFPTSNAVTLQIIEYTPQLVSAVFFPDGSKLRVTFDAGINILGWGRSFFCGVVFEYPGASLTTCQWINAQVLDITYPAGISSGAIVGDKFRVFDDILVPRCSSNYPILSDCNFLFPIRASSVIIRAEAAAKPVVVLPSTLTSTYCISPTIDATRSYGSGGRRWVSGAVTVTGTSSKVSSLQSFLSSKMDSFINSAPVTIPTEHLDSGFTFRITIELCNFLGVCGEGTMQLSIKAQEAPIVAIQQGSSVSVRRDDILRLSASYSLPFCDGTNLPSSQMGFNWTITRNGVLLRNVRNVARDFTRYQLPPYELNSSTSYIVSVTVWNKQNIVQKSATSTEVTVQRAPIKAVIAGNARKSLPFSSPLTLDATPSFDMNTRAPEPQTELSYLWTCERISPSYSKTCSSLNLGSLTSATLAISYKETTFLAYRYLFTVVASDRFDPRRNSSATAEVQLLAPAAPIVTITKSSTKVKLNSFESFKLTASVTLAAASTLTWSVNDSIVEWNNVISTPVTIALLPGTSSVQALLNLNHLYTGSAYLFSASVGITTVSVEVAINAPPKVGIFSVTPMEGKELDTLFAFQSALWVDDDLPLSFEFGFITTDLSKLLVQSLSPLTSVRSVLPSGRVSDAFRVICSATGYDSLGAFASTDTVIKVVPLSGGLVNAKLKTSLSDAGTSDSMKRSVSIAATVLNSAICTRAPDCDYLNRHACGSTANTCGRCMDGYFGDIGDANSACLDHLSYLAVDELVYCYYDQECPLWKECDLKSELCVFRQKECNWNCSGHGSCDYVSIDTGAPVEECFMGNFKCAAICTCHDGYFGSSCHVNSSVLDDSSDIRGTVLDKLSESASLEDFSLDSSISMISMLKAASQDPFSLTEDSSDATLSMASMLVDVAASAGVPVDKMLGVMSSIESVVSSYNPTSTGRRLGVINKRTLDNINEIIEKYGAAIANRWLADGKTQNDIVMNQFTATAAVFDGISDTITTTPSDLNSGFLGHSLEFLDDPRAKQVFLTVMRAKMFEHSAAMHSNPLRVVVRATNATNTVRIVINHNDRVDFPFTPSNLTLRTTCLEYSRKRETLQCPEGTEIVHQCNGSAAVLVSRCRGLKIQPYCQLVDLPLGRNPKCIMESHTATQTTCVCIVSSSGDRRRSLSYKSSSVLEDTGYIELTAMSEEVLAQFEGTLYSASDIKSIEDFAESSIVMVLYGMLWAVGLSAAYYFSVRAAYEKEGKLKLHSLMKDSRLSAIAKQARSIDTIKKYMNNYLNQVFPVVYASAPWYKRLVQEVLRNHRYLSLFSGDFADQRMIIFHLLTIQSMLMFMLAVFYDIQFPEDDGSCNNLPASSCEDEKSMFDSAKSKCSWNEDAVRCEFVDPTLGWQVVIIISVLVALFTSPINMLVDFIFNEVLSAPTADSLKLKEQGNAIERAGRRFSEAVRRASVNTSAQVASTVSSVQYAFKKKQRSNNMRIVTTRLIPGETISAQTLAIASTSSVADSFKKARESFKANRETLLGGTTVSSANNSLLQALAHSNDPVASSIALFSEFQRELYAQRQVLRISERASFDAQWGLDSTGSYSVAVSTSRIPCLRSETSGAIIKKEICHVQLQVMEKYEKLKIANDSHVGLELLHLFVLDLLGRDTPAAKIFTAKSSNDFRHAMVVSKSTKYFAWVVVIILNLFFVIFSMLRGMQRGLRWQEGFAIACVVQFLVEIFLFETIECVWINYLIPDSASNEIRAIQFQLRQTIDRLCSVSTTDFKYFLDAPEYLFISTNLVKRFPDKLESMIVSSYHQHLPGELGKKWHDRMSSSRRHNTIERFFRNFGLFSLTTTFFQMIGATPPIFQRVAVRSAQPLIFAVLVIVAMFFYSNPLYSLVILLPILYKIIKVAYNYVTTGEAFPREQGEEAAAVFHRSNKSLMAPEPDLAVTVGRNTPDDLSKRARTPVQAVAPFPNADKKSRTTEVAFDDKDVSNNAPATFNANNSRRSRRTVIQTKKPVPDVDSDYLSVAPIESKVPIANAKVINKAAVHSIKSKPETLPKVVVLMDESSSSYDSEKSDSDSEFDADSQDEVTAFEAKGALAK